MAENEDGKNYYKRLTIVGVVIVSAILLIVLFTLPKNDESPSKKLEANTEAQVKYEESTANVVKTTLNLYYVHNGYYPIYINRVMEETRIDQESRNLFKEATEKTLAEFDYSVKGNESAYKFTYKSITGEVMESEGNYEEEYH